jgi:hypothetical protein
MLCFNQRSAQAAPVPNIQIHADRHLEFLELYRAWADELPQSERKRISSLVEGAWEEVGDHVEIVFKVDALFLAFLTTRGFRYRKT